MKRLYVSRVRVSEMVGREYCRTHWQRIRVSIIVASATTRYDQNQRTTQAIFPYLAVDGVKKTQENKQRVSSGIFNRMMSRMCWLLSQLCKKLTSKPLLNRIHEHTLNFISRVPTQAEVEETADVKNISF